MIRIFIIITLILPIISFTHNSISRSLSVTAYTSPNTPPVVALPSPQYFTSSSTPSSLPSPLTNYETEAALRNVKLSIKLSTILQETHQHTPPRQRGGSVKLQWVRNVKESQIVRAEVEEVTGLTVDDLTMEDLDGLLELGKRSKDR